MAPPFRRRSRRALLVGFPLLMLAACNCDDRLAALTGVLEAAVEGDSFRSELALDFGTSFPGQHLKRTVTLANHGSAAITLDSLQLDTGSVVALGRAPDAEHPFSIDLPVGTILQPRDEVPATVWFAAASELDPDQPLSFSASVRIVAIDGSREASVRLLLSAQVAPCARIVPASLDFGSALSGTEVARSLGVTNAAPLDISLDVVPGSQQGDATELILGNVLPFAVPAESSRELPIRFRPTEAGIFGGSFAITSGNGCPASVVTWAGQGLAKLVDWSPEVIDCGWVMPGRTVERTITFLNHAAAPVVVSAASVSPMNQETSEAEFVLPAEEWKDGFELPPGDSISRTIDCSPASVGRKSATLSFALSGDPNHGDVRLAAVAGGPQIAVEPADLAFGTVPFVERAQLSTSRSLVVRNEGYAPAGEHLEAMLKLGTDHGDGTYGAPFYRIEPGNSSTAVDEFDVVIPPSSTVLPGGWIKLAVRVIPKSAGEKRATLVLLSNTADGAEPRIALSAQALPLPPCNYRLSTSSLEFGIVHANRPQTLDVVIENRGSDANQRCLVYDLTLDQDNGTTFSLTRPFDSRIVEPGEALEIPVTFSPDEPPPWDDPREVFADIRIGVSSPSAPHIAVSAHAALGPACLEFLPREIDFGTLRVAENSVTISPRLANMCGQRVTVAAITLEGGNGTFDLTLPTPIPSGGLTVYCDKFGEPTWPDGETRLFTVRFAPGTSGVFRATVVVDLVRDGRRLRYAIPLRGRAGPNLRTEVSFTQGGGDPVDILWHVAPALDLDFMRAGLKPHLRALLSHLARSGNDFHLGIAGCIEDLQHPLRTHGILDSAPWAPDRFLTPATPDLANQLELKVRRGVINGIEDDVYCGRTDHGYHLLSAWRSFVPPASTVNVGFRRPSTRLALLSASQIFDFSVLGRDTGDRSSWPRPIDPLDPTVPNFPASNLGEYLSVLIGLAGPPFAGRLSFAALEARGPAPAPSPCGPSGFPAMLPYSHRISGDAMASLTGGAMDSLCTADASVWQTRMQRIAEVASGMRLWFPLPSPPDLARGPIEVLIDGLAVPAVDAAGQQVWAYDAEANAVKFILAASPLPGQRVDLRYDTRPVQ